MHGSSGFISPVLGIEDRFFAIVRVFIMMLIVLLEITHTCGKRCLRGFLSLMSQQQDRFEWESQQLQSVRHSGPMAKAKVFAKLSGPGWLQSAITLGGGSLASGLFLGVIGGFEMLWVQWLAMFFGVTMLCAISYVTLSTETSPSPVSAATSTPCWLGVAGRSSGQCGMGASAIRLGLWGHNQQSLCGIFRRIQTFAIHPSHDHAPFDGGGDPNHLELWRQG